MVSLSCFDDKRFILDDGIHSYAYDHCQIKKLTKLVAARPSQEGPPFSQSLMPPHSPPPLRSPRLAIFRVLFFTLHYTFLFQFLFCFWFLSGLRVNWHFHRPAMDRVSHSSTQQPDTVYKESFSPCFPIFSLPS